MTTNLFLPRNVFIIISGQAEFELDRSGSRGAGKLLIKFIRYNQNCTITVQL